jgi:uncharacterized protein
MKKIDDAHSAPLQSLTRRSLLQVGAGAATAGFLTGSGLEAFAEDMTQITVTGAAKGSNAGRALAAVAEVVNQHSKTVRATNRESGGFVDGTRLVAANRVQVAMSSGPYVDFWQRKLPPFVRDTAARDTLRGIGPSGDAILQIVVLKDSPIKTFMDLKGKRISFGPPGSNSNWTIDFALKAAGIRDTVRKDSLNWTDGATNVVDHKLDAFGIPNPIGSPAILQASYSAPIRILSIPDNVIKAFSDLSPGYFKEEINPGKVYKGMEDTPFTSVVYMSMLVSNKNVPDDVVYEVTRFTYDPKNYDFMTNIAVGWKSGLAQAKNPKFIGLMKQTGMQMHPGAERYWKERGFKV